MNVSNAQLQDNEQNVECSTPSDVLHLPQNVLHLSDVLTRYRDMPQNVLHQWRSKLFPERSLAGDWKLNPLHTLHVYWSLVLYACRAAAGCACATRTRCAPAPAPAAPRRRPPPVLPAPPLGSATRAPRRAGTASCRCRSATRAARAGPARRAPVSLRGVGARARGRGAHRLQALDDALHERELAGVGLVGELHRHAAQLVRARRRGRGRAALPGGHAQRGGAGHDALPRAPRSGPAHV